MTNRKSEVIPDAAIEAAAKAALGRNLNKRTLELILEAAAPHMLELQWGVRDRHSLTIAGHPSEESARATAAAHPDWYEVVSRPMPGLWTSK